MYKLISYKATGLIGFRSGLGKKTVELDLSDHLDHEVICICGDNGTGKSTLASTLHPWPWPTDGRNRFIEEGKEGSIIRIYRGDDGTEILTRCIYKPKKTNGEFDGHTCQAYFQVTKPGSEPTELNSNGNVTSYKELLYTYFGITKDFLNFASYSSAVASIVRMTDTERKDSVNMLIPNVKRFEVAYDVVNDKYKELRNMARNLSQKILTLRDEDSLEADLARLTKEIKRYTESREDEMKKLARYKGRLDELSGGQDLDGLISQYNLMISNLAVYDTEIDQIRSRLFKLYGRLGIDHDKGSVNFDGIDMVPANVIRYERRLASIDAAIENYGKRRDQLRTELESVDKELGETESMIYSIEMQDPKELEKTREAYVRQLESLRYTDHIDEYADMSYDEAVNVSRQVVMINQMVDSLYQEYGDLVTQYFQSDIDADGFVRKAEWDLDQITVIIQTNSAKRDQILRQLIEKEQYKKFQDRLRMRPSNCHIDDCPFISDAIKYAGISTELATLAKQYEEMGVMLESQVAKQKQIEQSITMNSDIQKLVQYLVSMEPLLVKYLKIPDLKTLYRAIGNGTWGNLLDIMTLKETASILSEKELYYQITNMRLPEIDHALEMARVYSSNREILEHQRDQLVTRRENLMTEMDEMKIHLGVGVNQREYYTRMKNSWAEIGNLLDRYRDLIRNQLETQNLVNDQDSKIQTIKELMDKSKEKKAVIAELDDLIRERNPLREKTNLDLDALRRLKIEQAEVERNFVIIDIIRRIVSPNKGIRKELLAMYMDEIRETANQLLLNTFQGKLYLEEFIITDKEFVIPYMASDSYGSDISYASSAQQSMISTAMSLAILSRILTRYGILSLDEVDAPLSPKNKGEFIPVLINQMRYIGVNQAILVTQSGDRYSAFDPLYILFPGSELNSKKETYIEIDS